MYVCGYISMQHSEINKEICSQEWQQIDFQFDLLQFSIRNRNNNNHVFTDRSVFSFYAFSHFHLPARRSYYFHTIKRKNFDSKTNKFVCIVYLKGILILLNATRQRTTNRAEWGKAKHILQQHKYASNASALLRFECSRSSKIN